jgi:hypothetical protein
MSNYGQLVVLLQRGGGERGFILCSPTHPRFEEPRALIGMVCTLVQLTNYSALEHATAHPYLVSYEYNLYPHLGV